MLRLRALTMPSVTVPASPSGAPIAIARSPTFRSSEFANSAGCRPVASTLMTARSETGSVPTTVAASSRPSWVVTRTSGDDTAPSRVMTWLLVRMWPSSSSTTPEPVPAPESERTEMVTTDGDALTAAAVTTVASPGSLTVTVVGRVTPVTGEPVLDEVAQRLTPAPETPPTRAPMARAATTGTERDRLGAAGAAMSAAASWPTDESGESIGSVDGTCGASLMRCLLLPSVASIHRQPEHHIRASREHAGEFLGLGDRVLSSPDRPD